LLKNKKDCTDVYCVTLIELQAHHDAFIQNISSSCFAGCISREYVTCRLHHLDLKELGLAIDKTGHRFVKILLFLKHQLW